MKNKRKYAKENYLKNGTKIQNNNPKNNCVFQRKYICKLLHSYSDSKTWNPADI